MSWDIYGQCEIITAIRAINIFIKTDLRAVGRPLTWSGLEETVGSQERDPDRGEAWKMWFGGAYLRRASSVPSPEGHRWGTSRKD